MRKMSQDGGDSTSITSATENETKKSGTGIMKTTRNSIKRKVQNFHHESDDTVIEPLLQKEKEKMEGENQSAKYILSKTKTDSMGEKDADKEKVFSENKIGATSLANVPGTNAERISFSNGINNSDNQKLYSSATVPIHNHMNTNIFSSYDGAKTSKNQILVEIEGSKQISYNPSSLIFTTAKIHTDSKAKHLEPVHVTAVPIVSTIEGVVKAGTMDYDKNFDVLSRTGSDNLSSNMKHNRSDPKSKEQENILLTSTSLAKDISNPKSSTVMSPKGNDKIKYELLNKNSVLPWAESTTSVINKTSPDFIINNITLTHSLRTQNSIKAVDTKSYMSKTSGTSVTEETQKDFNKNVQRVSDISCQKGPIFDHEVTKHANLKNDSNSVSSKQLQRQKNTTVPSSVVAILSPKSEKKIITEHKLAVTLCTPSTELIKTSEAIPISRTSTSTSKSTTTIKPTDNVVETIQSSSKLNISKAHSILNEPKIITSNVSPKTPLTVLPATSSTVSISKPFSAAASITTTASKSSVPKTELCVIPCEKLTFTSTTTETRKLSETVPTTIIASTVKSTQYVSTTIPSKPINSSTKTLNVTSEKTVSSVGSTPNMTSKSSFIIATPTSLKSAIVTTSQPTSTSIVSHISTNLSKSMGNSNGKPVTSASTASTIKSASSNKPNEKTNELNKNDKDFKA